MSRTGPRILYIDDDPALGRLVQRDLARHGWAVVLATTGAQGEALAGEGGFDAICLDHFMPDQDGLVTLKRLRARPDTPPVVYVTGSEEGRVAIAALRAGAAEYVIKEANPDFLGVLRAALETAIRQEAQRREKARAEAEMRIARDRAEELARQRQALLQEASHRVANSLQLIAALTTVQEAAATDPAVRMALAEVRNRVVAVGRVHQLLYASSHVRSVALDAYLRSLVEEIHRSADRGDRFRFSLDLAHLTVPTDNAVQVGVILAELLTNAMKYAYPGEAGGPIRVALAIAGEEAVLTVADEGVGMAPGAARGSGVGSRIIGSMARTLRGRVEQEPGEPGTRIRIIFPVPQC